MPDRMFRDLRDLGYSDAQIIEFARMVMLSVNHESKVAQLIELSHDVASEAGRVLRP
jgi:hypothetical protein